MTQASGPLPDAPDAASAVPQVPEFQAFTVEHGVILAIIAAACALCAWLGRRTPPGSDRDRRVRTVLFLLLFGGELHWQGWMVGAGEWGADHALPLHLCDLTLMLLMVALYTGRTWAIELSYYWGLIGVTTALILPDLAEIEWPSYASVRFWTAHGLALCAVAWLSAGQKLAPVRGGLKRAVPTTLGVMVVVWMLNGVSGGNYLYLSERPKGPAENLMPPEPWHAFLGAAVLLALMAVLHLPAALGWREQTEETDPPAGR